VEQAPEPNPQTQIRQQKAIYCWSDGNKAWVQTERRFFRSTGRSGSSRSTPYGQGNIKQNKWSLLGAYAPL